MKVLLANNYFYHRGGSERVFFDEAALLGFKGHEVFYFATRSERNLPTPFSKYFVSELEYKLKNIARFIYCLESKKKIHEILNDLKPNIAHLHNIYQDISPSVLPVLKKYDIPSVLTLHDLKLICPNYLLMHDGIICEDCYGGRFYRCVLNRCKQKSYAYSIVPALEAYVHKILNIWKGYVSYFISPSHFLKNKLVEFGWDGEHIEVVSNCLSLEHYLPNYEAGDYFLYLGRLSQEKGLLTMFAAFQQLPSCARLLVVGGGPIEAELKQSVEGDERITFTGYLEGENLVRMTRKARALVIPSECYENAPMSILEAMAYGKPVIGSRIGGIPEMVEEGVNGYLFEPGNADDLKDKLELMLSKPKKDIEQMGKTARDKVEREYNAELHYERLMEVYNKALTGV